MHEHCVKNDHVADNKVTFRPTASDDETINQIRGHLNAQRAYVTRADVLRVGLNAAKIMMAEGIDIVPLSRRG